MANDPELSMWADDFLEPDPAPAPSTDEILAQAARDRRRERLEWAQQTGGTLFAVFVFLALVVRTRSVLVAVLSAVVLPTLFALFALFAHQQRAASASRGTSVVSHVALAVRRRTASHRVARASRVGLAVMTLAFWSWYPLFVLSKADKIAAEPWRLVVGVACAVLVFGAAFWHVTRLVRRTEADLARWKAVAASLE